jgi:autotransporter translocation and assembly factor TamB
MRPIRPAVILAGCLLAGSVAVTALVWHQGSFLRESAANYLRERLAVEFGAKFQTTDLRGTWFPPGLSLGRVTLDRPGEPQVLTAEDVRISFNPYALLFGRERLGRVVVVRPRLYVRTGPDAGADGSPAGAPAGALPTAAISPALQERVRSFLRPPFTLRVFEIVDGRAEVSDANGKRLHADGINLSVLISSGSAHATLAVGSLAVGRRGRLTNLGRIATDLTIEGGRIAVGKLVADGGPIAGRLAGTVGFDGRLALNGALSARVEDLAALTGRAGAAGGMAHFKGAIAGVWREPAVTGSLSLQDLAVAGNRWPGVQGDIAWSGSRATWERLRLPVGDGEVTCAGEVDFSGAAPRYRIDVAARALDLARLPVAREGFAARVTGLGGTLHWEGAGLGAEATGSGRLAAQATVADLAGGQIGIAADASLDRGRAAFTALRAAAGAFVLEGTGAWTREAGFSAHLVGTVADLAQLLPPGGIAYGGSARIEGDLAVDALGPRFQGLAHLAGGAVGALRGIAGRVRVSAEAGSVRFSEGALTWPGGGSSLAGTIGTPSGQLDLVALLRQDSLQQAASAFGADPQSVAGSLQAKLHVLGTIAAPVVEGEASAKALRVGTVALDEAGLSLAYENRRLRITRLKARRGSSELAFRGALGPESEIEGTFESRAFNSADFSSFAGLQVTGTVRGAVSGRLRDPRVEALVRADQLRYAGFDFKGGELSVGYRNGAATVEGWVASRENRLRIVVEPSRDWRFDADLELRQFAPELVRSGIGAFPPALAQALGRASFLAAGRLRGSGRLFDPRSMRVDLQLDTLWLQGAGATLQNLSPVRISWRDAGLVVEDFRLASDRYHLSVSGGGSPAAGWNLQAEGAVNLSVFKEYWREIEEVEGRGDLTLNLGGPWLAPLPEGSLTVNEAYVRVRSLPEPLEHLTGRLELHGRTLSATGLSGTMSGGAFRGGGTYQLAQDRLEVDVEGRLDLSLFRARIPAARELRGPLEVRLRMAGPLGSPVFSGSVDVLDAELFLRPFPAKITHLRGTVLLGTERLEVRGLSGQTGGGTVELSGNLDWTHSPARVDANLSGKGILVSLAGALKAQSDLKLGVHGDFQDMKLAGEVRILKARYLREFDEKLPPLDPGAGAATAASGKGPDLSRLALDVNVVAADNVWVANRMAKIETAVALHVGGTLGKPVVSGEISAIQGEAFYLSRQFRLESGSLRFVPPALIPLLDVQASTSVGDTQIFFLMDGPVNHPSYHLSSLPAMTQEDLISLLAIGETRTNLARRGERASAAGAAVITTEPLLNALGDGARSTLGLDVLQLEPVIGVNNQMSARVTLGSHVSDRLYVSYTQNLAATQDQQVTVQYYLLDYLSIWGRELRQGIYSFDLVFRYAIK